MAHFAKLGPGDIVERVEVVSNDIATTEQAGVDFLNNLYGTRDVWKQTSYNGNIRKNFAGVGHKYDQTRDAFIDKKALISTHSGGGGSVFLSSFRDQLEYMGCTVYHRNICVNRKQEFNPESVEKILLGFKNLL